MSSNYIQYNKDWHLHPTAKAVIFIMRSNEILARSNLLATNPRIEDMTNNYFHKRWLNTIIENRYSTG